MWGKLFEICKSENILNLSSYLTESLSQNSKLEIVFLQNFEKLLLYFWPGFPCCCCDTQCHSHSWIVVLVSVSGSLYDLYPQCSEISLQGSVYLYLLIRMGSFNLKADVLQFWEILLISQVVSSPRFSFSFETHAFGNWTSWTDLLSFLPFSIFALLLLFGRLFFF